MFSLIPAAAKRMSKSFVESVISADSIWEEQDCCDMKSSYSENQTRRYSRYHTNPNPHKHRKSRRKSKSKSKHDRNVSDLRRHSLPSNIYEDKQRYPWITIGLRVRLR